MTYTNEQIEAWSKHCDAVEEHDAARMLPSWIAERKKMVVTDEMADCARSKMAEVCGLYVAREYMSSALEPAIQEMQK